MKVILLENVESVGKTGEIADVSEGYARNFLFPLGKAARASEGQIREAEATKTRAAKQAEAELGDAQRLVELLDQKTVTLRAPVGPQGKLQNAVTATDIAAALEKATGARLPTNAVRVRSPIREPGEQKVRLELPHGLEADVSVSIEGIAPESSPEKK